MITLLPSDAKLSFDPILRASIFHIRWYMYEGGIIDGSEVVAAAGIWDRTHTRSKCDAPAGRVF